MPLLQQGHPPGGEDLCAGQRGGELLVPGGLNGGTGGRIPTWFSQDVSIQQFESVCV